MLATGNGRYQYEDINSLNLSVDITFADSDY